MTFAGPIFDRLRGHNIPTKSYYAETELETIDAQERFALLKLLLNNEDRVALRWLLGHGHQTWRAPQYAPLLERVRQDGTSPWVTLERLRAGDIAVPQTGHILARFDAIKAQLSELQAAADVDEFIELWLPPDPSTELLAEAVAEARQEAATVPELYSALYAGITEPEVPLEVKEVRVMSLHKSKGLSLARDGL